MKNPPAWDEQDSSYPPPSHPVFQGLRDQSVRSKNRREPITRNSNMSRWDGPWSSYRGQREYEEYDEGESSRIVAQVIGAALLVLGVFLTFHSTIPGAERMQQVVRTVMTQEMNLTAAKDWLTLHTGIDSLSLPVVSNGAGNTGGETVAYVPPLVDYKVSTPFDAAKHPALILQTAAGAEVKTVAKGQVKTYDKNDQYGIYIVIDHGKNGQTLYGHLDSVTVKPGDWVYTGQAIGKTGTAEPADLYFAHFLKNKPVDPQGILAQAKR